MLRLKDGQIFCSDGDDYADGVNGNDQLLGDDGDDQAAAVTMQM